MSVPRRAMVFGAGLGTRLRPLTEDRPKALVDLGGHAMIDFPIRWLAAAGVEEIVVNLHHHAERLREHLGSGDRYGVRIRTSPEDPILDTGGGLAAARPLLEGEDFFLVNCDVLTDLDLTRLAAIHRSSGALATLAVRRDPRAREYGLVEIDDEGWVRRFLGRPPDAPGALHPRMFCGVHVLGPAIFDHLPAREVFSITRDVYAHTVERGHALRAVTHEGYWRDLGTFASLEAARGDLAAGSFAPPWLPAPD